MYEVYKMKNLSLGANIRAVLADCVTCSIT
jgi:hypothetical protein